MELTDSETGLYRPAEEPALLFQQAGADRTQRVVTYCGGGIAASNDAFILAMLGYENVAVYDASLSEYARTRHCRWRSPECPEVLAVVL